MMTARRRTWRPWQRNNQGFALIALLVLLTMGGLYFFLNNLTPEAIEAQRQAKTDTAMVQARDALIGYALQYRDEEAGQGRPDRMYGYLPLPDLGSSRNNNTDPKCRDASNNPLEGCDANTPTAITCDDNNIYPTMVGRFPWRTLGTGPLRDGHGECLWLIVSSLHLRKQCANPTLPPMNWDTLGQLDIVTANGTGALNSALATHDRPVAIIFSPGPALPGQDRSNPGGNDVSQCGGNYNAANYLDPAIANALGGATNYLSGTNNASGTTGDSNTSNDPDAPKPMLINGKVFESGANFLPDGCTGSNCELLANDNGLAITGDTLFGAIRKNANFRADVNSMLDRMTTCLRDRFAAGGTLALDANSTGLTVAGDKIAGRVPASSCYDNSTDPRGYFDHYKDLAFVAKQSSGMFSVNGQSCEGVVAFANQRGAVQRRVTSADKHSLDMYLEGENLSSFKSGGSSFSGPGKFDRVSATQSASQDIVRCIVGGASLFTPPSPGLTAAGLSQLATYTPATRSLALGQEVSTDLATSLAGDLFGCAWTSETHGMGAGLRSYFSFRINDAGFSSAAHEGFTFAIVDGDNNGANTCGAARQHLGYSGNNLDTPFIVPPKIAFEIDPRREDTFNPAVTDTLTNGRNDPPTGSTTYRGGHVAIVYWGGETSILATGTATGTFPPCTAPRIATGSECYLPPEQDDNVHGQATNARSGFPPPPANPSAPALPLSVPPDSPAGVYKLDPNRSQIPTNQDFHVRVELSRATATFALPTVRAATTAHLDLAAPGTIIDGVILIAGDRVLLKDQASLATNGIYIWNSATSAMTRATDADTTTEIAGLAVEVEQGAKQARSIWRQTNTNPTLGSDAIRWTNVRTKLATASNIDLASPGATLDGIMMAMGDRVLVKAQTISSDNGIYVWNGATSAMTRASDADTVAKLTGLVVQVQQGSDATAWWRFDGASWGRLSVRVATQSAIDLSNPGASIDGIALAAGDRVLVKAQASSADNGIYVWNGPSNAMTRATDADTAAKLAGVITQVQLGTDTGRAMRQTSLSVNDTLGSGRVEWAAIDPSPRFLVEIWILPDSLTDANKIATMKNTTRPMSLLYPTFIPQLRDSPTIGYPFRNVRLGFTTGQQRMATDQTFTIGNIFTTWLD